MRAVGIIHNRRRACDMTAAATWRAQWKWRTGDGMLLLAAAGGILGHALWLLVT
jgi:hypothetical protein